MPAGRLLPLDSFASGTLEHMPDQALPKPCGPKYYNPLDSAVPPEAGRLTGNIDEPEASSPRRSQDRPAQTFRHKSATMVHSIARNRGHGRTRESGESE